MSLHLKDANEERKEMLNKDGFVCITGLPGELREGHGKDVSPRCQTNKTM